MKTKTKFSTVVILAATTISLLSASCRSVYCTAYSGKPSQIISVEQAVAMKNEYTNKVAPLIEAANVNNYQATEFAWISLDTLKKYIAYLDKIEEVNGKEISGVRIYFAAYPNQNTFANTAAKIMHPGRETVFLAPTITVPESNLSIQYRNLENLPFYIQPKAKDGLIGDFVVIDALRYKSDNAMPMPVNATKSAGDPVPPPTTNPTSVILDNLGLVPPPKTPR